MITEHRLGCDHCSFMVTTVAPHREIDGRLLARCYCAACGEARECVVGTRAAPRAPLGVPIGPRHGQAARLARTLTGRIHADGWLAGAARCPACGEDDLVLVPQAGHEPPCPRCHAGRLFPQRV